MDESETSRVSMETKGLTCCAAADCASVDLLVKVSAGLSWLRYCPRHGREVLSLSPCEREKRLAEDLALCQKSWDWSRF